MKYREFVDLLKSKNILLKDVLSSTKDIKSPYFDFVKSFVKKHKQFMLDNLFNELVTHPLREELIKIDTSELEKQSYI